MVQGEENPPGALGDSWILSLDPEADEGLEVRAAALSHLRESLASRTPDIFLEWLRWQRRVELSRPQAPPLLAGTLDEIARSLAAGDHDDDARALVQRGIEELDCAPVSASERDGHHPLVGEYLGHLMRGRTAEATRLLKTAVADGMSLRSLYLDVLGPAQIEIGRRWQQNEITVAEEHYCSAVAQMLMAELSAGLGAAAEPTGKSLLVACVAGNRHELGLRMIADLFLMEGWEVHFLGANTPAGDLARMATRLEPDLIGLSASLAPQLTAVRRTLRALDECALRPRPPVLVGGLVASRHGDLVLEMGADAAVSDPEGALRQARDLVARRDPG